MYRLKCEKMFTLVVISIHFSLLTMVPTIFALALGNTNTNSNSNPPVVIVESVSATTVPPSPQPSSLSYPLSLPSLRGTIEVAATTSTDNKSNKIVSTGQSKAMQVPPAPPTQTTNNDKKVHIVIASAGVSDETENLNSNSFHVAALSQVKSRDKIIKGSTDNHGKNNNKWKTNDNNITNSNSKTSNDDGGSDDDDGEGDLNVKGNESLVSGTQRQVDDVQQVELSGPQTATDAFSRRRNYVATTVEPPLWFKGFQKQLQLPSQSLPKLTASEQRLRVAKVMRGFNRDENDAKELVKSDLKTTKTGVNLSNDQNEEETEDKQRPTTEPEENLLANPFSTFLNIITWMFSSVKSQGDSDGVEDNGFGIGSGGGDSHGGDEDNDSEPIDSVNATRQDKIQDGDNGEAKLSSWWPGGYGTGRMLVGKTKASRSDDDVTNHPVSTARNDDGDSNDDDDIDGEAVTQTITTTTTDKNITSDTGLVTATEQGRYIKGDPLNGYYDFVITEGSYKFWVAFQLATALLIIYSTFAAIYYSKVNPIVSDYEYQDYLGGRSFSEKQADEDNVDVEDDNDTNGVDVNDDEDGGNHNENISGNDSATTTTPTTNSPTWADWWRTGKYALEFILRAIESRPQ